MNSLIHSSPRDWLLVITHSFARMFWTKCVTAPFFLFFSFLFFFTGLKKNRAPGYKFGGCVLIWSLELMSCVTLSKSLNLSEP